MFTYVLKIKFTNRSLPVSTVSKRLVKLEVVHEIDNGPIKKCNYNRTMLELKYFFE